jgi:muramoyltetrapeptide carboxypeptidase
VKRLSGPLRPGDAVALVCPSGPPGDDALDEAVARLEALDLEVRPGRHVRRRHGYLAGTDDERRADLAWALSDPQIRAVVCGRGGYGAARLLRGLPWRDLARDAPRPLLGFSDITALHLALARLGWPTLHGAMPAGGTWNDFNREGVRRALMSSEPLGRLPHPEEMPPPTVLAAGEAEGVLVGGNLTLMASLMGTPWQLQAAGKILLLEDVGEEVYRVDRYLAQLALAGVLDGVAGVVVGEWREIAQGEPSLSLEQVLQDALGSLGVPVLTGLPLGHGVYRATVPLGCRVRLSCPPQGEPSLTFLESPYGR